LRRNLKKTAVPTRNLYNQKPATEASTSRNKRLSERKTKQEVSKLLEAAALPSLIDTEHLIEDHANPEPPSSHTEDLNYEAKYREILDKYNDLNKKYSLLKTSSNKKDKKIKILNDQLRYFKDKYYRSPTSNKSEMASTLLKTVLTQNQIDLLSKKKKRVNWTREEIAVAFSLRYYSKKCYLYLRSKLRYPLPALSSLRKWASQLNVSQGILSDVLLMLKLAGESFFTFEKTTVLQFDEVKVKAVEEYNVAQDEILGPYKYMQVVMVRGLFSNWKQPVFIAFDQKMTKQILFEIITELHKISYNVVACVSDCGGSNVRLWKELGVDINNTSFKHPVSDNHIYMFADAPHLLKLFRNWLLDAGFKLKDGSVLNKNPLQALIP
jgi:hypothetical protein